MLNEEYIQKLRDLPIQQVAIRLGQTIDRGRILCQWHPDKHPSMSFSKDGRHCHCWSCGKSADVIELVQQVRGCGFLEACEWLGNEYSVIQTMTVSDIGNGPKREYKQYPPDVNFLGELIRYPYLSPEAQHFLYEERRIDPRVVRWCRLTSINTPMPCYRGGRPFYDAPSLLIPYFGVDGRLLSVQSRYLGPRTEGVPRFRFPRNSNCPIYNLPVLNLLKGDEELLITEGPSDCWAALSSGRKAIAIGSATLLRDEDFVEALLPHRSHWSGDLGCYPDQDAAGEKLYSQLLRVSVTMGITLVKHQLLDGVKDYAEHWAASQNSFEPQR